MEKNENNLSSGRGGEVQSELDVPDAIMSLVQKRQLARAAKRWEEADALRERIKAAGYQIEDTPQGSRVRAKWLNIRGLSDGETRGLR